MRIWGGGGGNLVTNVLLDPSSSSAASTWGGCAWFCGDLQQNSPFCIIFDLLIHVLPVWTSASHAKTSVNTFDQRAHVCVNKGERRGEEGGGRRVLQPISEVILDYGQLIQKLARMSSVF